MPSTSCMSQPVVTRTIKGSPRLEGDKKAPVLRASRVYRNYQTIQETICIALLNQFSDISIKQPTKKSVVTQQFMRINTISFGDEDDIDVTGFLRGRCLDHKNFDLKSGVSTKTADRRYQNNKKIEMLHLLIDLLMVNGYHFKTKTTEGKSGVFKLEAIKEIYYKDKLVYTNSEIEERAAQINQYLVHRLHQSNGELTLERNDDNISLLL
ncbi:TATA-binding protein-associated phosphoprotein [Entamoeba marina]